MTTTVEEQAVAHLTGEDRRRYLGCLETADEQAATDLALDLLDTGVPAAEVLLGLVARTQVEVGARWEADEWSVAEEHAATHISERVVAAVASRTRGSQPPRGHVVVACVDGEWHALAARLLGEVLRLHGWSVRFLGASVPAPHLVSYLHQYGPDAVAVSCSIPTRLPKAQRVIEACQSAGVPVLAGGRGFGPGARYAVRLGADAWAADAVEAARLLEAWPPATRRREPTGPLDDEHTLVQKRRVELVEAGWAELTRRFPPLAAYADAQREHTLDDLGHIVDFLSASLFVDDPELFTGFVSWLSGILEARRVPSASVDLALHAFDEALYDFPRARRHLAEGRRALESDDAPVAGDRHGPSGKER